VTFTDEELQAIVKTVGPPRGGVGRPYIPIDLEKVRELLTLGFSMNQVGQVFGCSRETLRRRLNGQ
jgi:hypothetical protein